MFARMRLALGNAMSQTLGLLHKSMTWPQRLAIAVGPDIRQTITWRVFMSFASEFKEFALKGNVVDLAVGVIIGGAFGKIVDSMVGDIIMPIVGAIIG